MPMPEMKSGSFTSSLTLLQGGPGGAFSAFRANAGKAHNANIAHMIKIPTILHIGLPPFRFVNVANPLWPPQADAREGRIVYGPAALSADVAPEQCFSTEGIRSFSSGLLIAALAQTVRLARWRAIASWREPLVLILYIGYAFGLIIVAPATRACLARANRSH